MSATVQIWLSAEQSQARGEGVRVLVGGKNFARPKVTLRSDPVLHRVFGADPLSPGADGILTRAPKGAATAAPFLVLVQITQGV